MGSIWKEGSLRFAVTMKIGKGILRRRWESEECGIGRTEPGNKIEDFVSVWIDIVNSKNGVTTYQSQTSASSTRQNLPFSSNGRDQSVE
jgi:hypothetical protein